MATFNLVKDEECKITVNDNGNLVDVYVIDAYSIMIESQAEFDQLVNPDPASTYHDLVINKMHAAYNLNFNRSTISFFLLEVNKMVVDIKKKCVGLPTQSASTETSDSNSDQET